MMANTPMMANLSINYKNVFLLLIPTEVAFCAKILYPSHQDSIFQRSI